MKSKGKIFKAVIISMMIFVILSTGLSFILYLGGDKNIEQNDENTIDLEVLSGEIETGNLDIIDEGNLNLTGN